MACFFNTIQIQFQTLLFEKFPPSIAFLLLQAAEHTRSLMEYFGKESTATSDYHFLLEADYEKGKKWYSCPLCQEDVHTLETGMLAHLLYHINDLHNQKKKCNKCSIEFDTMGDTIAHLWQHRLSNEDRPAKTRTACTCRSIRYYFCALITKLGTMKPRSF